MQKTRSFTAADSVHGYHAYLVEPFCESFLIDKITMICTNDCSKRPFDCEEGINEENTLHIAHDFDISILFIANG